jgi:hypothetical protein
MNSDRRTDPDRQATRSRRATREGVATSVEAIFLSTFVLVTQNRSEFNQREWEGA